MERPDPGARGEIAPARCRETAASAARISRALPSLRQSRPARRCPGPPVGDPGLPRSSCTRPRRTPLHAGPRRRHPATAPAPPAPHAIAGAARRRDRRGDGAGHPALPAPPASPDRLTRTDAGAEGPGLPLRTEPGSHGGRTYTAPCWRIEARPNAPPAATVPVTTQDPPSPSPRRCGHSAVPAIAPLAGASAPAPRPAPNRRRGSNRRSSARSASRPRMA